MSLIATIARWIIALPCALLYAVCVVGNWSVILGLLLGRIKSAALILPFLGPVFGMIAVFAAPIAGLRRFWWVALIAEPSVWLILLAWPKTAIFGKKNLKEKPQYPHFTPRAGPPG